VVDREWAPGVAALSAGWLGPATRSYVSRAKRGHGCWNALCCPIDAPLGLVAHHTDITMLKPASIGRLLTLRRSGRSRPFRIPLEYLPHPFVRSITIQAPPPGSQVDRHDPANYSIIDASPATSSIPSTPPAYPSPPLSGSSQHPFAVSGGPQPEAGPSTQPHQTPQAKQHEAPESTDTDEETSAVSIVRSVPYAVFRKGAEFRAENHPFDSQAFVNTLMQSGFKEPGARTVMETFRGMLRWRWSQTQTNNMSRLTFENVRKDSSSLLLFADAPKEQTLFKAQLTDLRQSLSSTTRKELAALGSAVSAIKREADALGQKIKEDVTLLQHEWVGRQPGSPGGLMADDI